MNILKTAILICFIIFGQVCFVNAQHIRQNPHPVPLNNPPNTEVSPPNGLTNDTHVDVHFYHLDVEIAIDSAYIQGHVSYIFTSTIDGLNSVSLDLDNAFIVDSVSSPASGFNFIGNGLYIELEETYNKGESFSFSVYYHGKPPLAGGYKGLRYEKHDGDEPIIASLSTPYLAHTWWPCKDGVYDKADSCYIDITIKDSIINDVPLIAVSNGLLHDIVSKDNKKTFQWRHKYPVVPYYMMVAISNFEHFQQSFIAANYSFPLDYFVFTSHLSSAQNGVSQMPDVMAFFTEIFGDYPFRNEKYGMVQLGYYGGIENQTNSIINNMSSSWFNVSVHELAHQWFADMITCETWNHGWLNEGFANYSEALFDEHVNGFVSYQNYMKNFEYYGSGTIYLQDVSDPFNVFQGIIYDKGAYLLHMLRGVLSDADFFDAIKTYATSATFQYDHASTEDFQMVCENISGIDLDYFFEQWVYDERFPKYRYNYSSDPGTGDINLTIKQTQSSSGWRNVFEMPMEIKIEFEDLTDTIVRIHNDTEIQHFLFTMPKDVINVTLDPNQWILKNVVFDEDLPVANSNIALDNIYIYPNPTNQGIYIETSSDLGPLKIKLYDVQGSLLNHQNFITLNKRFFVNTENLKPGIYIIELNTKKGQFLKKISVVN